MKHKAKGGHAGAGTTGSTKSGGGKGGGQTAAGPTKGKGKGAVAGGAGQSTAGAQSGEGSASASFDLADTPLSLPEFTPPSATAHQEWVPRYHALLKRDESGATVGSHGPPLGVEEVDTLQLELEAMLTNTRVRRNAIQRELQLGGGPASPGKRGATLGSLVGRDGSKRFKAAGKPVGDKSNTVLTLPKIKNEQSVPTFDPLQNEQIRPLNDTTKPALPKNETPNRFWSFVEPYCAPITPEDIKLLEDLIKTHQDMSEYHKIPPLGQHYTQLWAKEDMENERVKSSSLNETNGESLLSNADDLLVPKNEPGSEEAPYGELTQRLVAGLMEESVMTSTDDSMEAAKKAGLENQDHLGKANLIKSLNVSNADSLEARVRKELEDQGILDPNENNSVSAFEGDNDEILEELKRCQTELKAVSSHNLNQLKRLLKCAKEEMIRQELRNKLQKADEEVMEAYQKISVARSKKKSPNKKEREQAWKALKEREIVLKELESV
eukprot:TCALIF_02405-PA protein Name:"Similar to tada3-a Transcriptional adapter 3-A (Xenopus laevis)" AED:0.25 eAED:0.25 QI:43/0/0/0.66/1/0.66/3/0/494